MPMTWPRAMVVSAVLSSALAACSLPAIPADPDGTLDRVRADGLLRAGASANPPRVVVTPSNEAPVGPEVDLVEGFADDLGVRVEWTVGGESELVGHLEDGAVDVVVSGLLEDSPWEQRVTLTRPYAGESAPDGTERRYVMATPLGENALLAALERYLDQAADEEDAP